MPTLYDITEDMRALDGLLAEAGGDVSDDQVESAIDEWLAELTGARDTKIDGYLCYIAERKARAVAKRGEVLRLEKSARVDENAVDRLRARLRQYMEALGEQQIRTSRHTVTLAKAGKPRLVIDVDPKDLPDSLRRVLVSFEPDKRLIRQTLEEGNEVQGCRLEPGTSTLRIR